jgi:superfamily II DNA or RNA helicase
MLNRFFKNDNNNSAQGRMYGEAVKWRLKGHAELPFWRWVCSWAKAIRKPSDIGYDDTLFILPKLIESDHLVKANSLPDGMLFELPAITLEEQREERKRTLQERCEQIKNIVNHNEPSLIWCNLNQEGDLLEKIIPYAEQVSGKDNDERKEQKLMAFAKGDIQKLITKPKIGAWGLNYQHCSHVTFFPTHSYEQYYQGIRRCYRFGQKKSVRVDIVHTEGELKVLQNLKRKAKQADRMFTSLINEMNNAVSISDKNYYTKKEELPPWL